MNLTVENVTGGYGSRIVLHEVNFSLQPGEVVCLLGANGCGKTTLFKMILRLLRPKSGCVRLGGENIAGWNEQRLARSFGYVPQMHTPPFAFLVRDIVLMARAAHLRPFASPGKFDIRIAGEALDSLGILRLASERYTEISGGERQLVLIARALAQKAQWLILDEPAASLDLGNQLKVLRAIRELSKTGLGVLMTTHDPGHAFQYASRVALMSCGRIIALDDPAKALTRLSLQQAYGVPLHVVESPDHPGMKMVLPDLS
ncbi:MAG: ABC transporter ATP-binding protein [Candidatus Korobacteraceae bacterium]|jgi:ABC-type cobalamin/Fe3+-siderophores transport system ATPase subunit